MTTLAFSLLAMGSQQPLIMARHRYFSPNTSAVVAECKGCEGRNCYTDRPYVALSAAQKAPHREARKAPPGKRHVAQSATREAPRGTKRHACKAPLGTKRHARRKRHTQSHTLIPNWSGMNTKKFNSSGTPTECVLVQLSVRVNRMIRGP